MGRMLLAGTPESTYKRIPRIDNVHGIIFTAAGRVYNRDELIAACGLRIAEHEKSGMPDGEILFSAYRNWGEACPVRIYGDWAFAAYDKKERRLFIARDHFGTTSLYYHADSRVFAFASSRSALLALDLAPREMDDLYLGQVLVSWFAYHGERTIHKPVKRLPPAHCLTVTPERMEKRRFWRLEETAELRLPKREDYVAAFREVFDEAVRCRLRSGDNIAATLSGGLDSGSVTATAVRLMQGEGKRLIAVTSVPLYDTRMYVGSRIGDEFPLARATAQYSENIELSPITGATLCPIQAIRRFLTVIDEPSHGAGNLFWILALMEHARNHGCRTLLTGQMGNAGMSWEGDVFSQSPGFQLRRLGWKQWPKEAAKRYLPVRLLKAYRNIGRAKDGWWRTSAINPEFAGRLNLLDRLLSAPDSLMAPQSRSPFEQRCRIIKPGRSFVGAVWAELGAACGLEVRDPTADARVLAFTLSVPDHVFMDPKTGVDRWLIREAMKGRLPDEVRLNRRRGRQAGDLVPRLRACADEVEAALDELASGPAAAYVNVPYMREVWAMVRTDDTPEAFHKAVTVLTRGIMAGLWVNGFHNA
ncbi:MAG: asparagine synthase-related protein [Geobacteraceae bacterium]|nr:asparagine synthase-related protein [Geobacteraceae bacterium]